MSKGGKDLEKSEVRIEDREVIDGKLKVCLRPLAKDSAMTSYAHKRHSAEQPNTEEQVIKQQASF
jgi:hypothetical protein